MSEVRCQRSKDNFFLFSVFCLLISDFCFGGFPAAGQEWERLGGGHFIAYFVKDEREAEGVLDKAEQYYRRIARDLGYTRYSEFWLWDDRVKIYIYADKASFLAGTGQPQWSEGMADYTNKLIAGYAGSRDFKESILPHEIAHLIFRDFVGFKGEVPLWLDEGVAQWAEIKKRREMKKMARDYFREGKLLLVEDMIKLDVRRLSMLDRIYIRPSQTEKGDAGVLFLSAENLVHTYYLQSVSLVGFLIERYGSERFTHFCRQLRDGKSLEEALRFAYPPHIRSVAEFESRWREYLAQQ